jgi:hypothetical protein
MQMVKLRNGSEEALPLVTAVMMSLQSLDPITQYELVMVARNRDHKPFGNTGDKLRDLRLLPMHQSVRNVVLSAFHGEGLQMALRSPVIND